MIAMRLIAGLVLGLAATAPHSAIAAEPYPARTVKLVSPFPAGGGADAICRVIAERMRGPLGQVVIVENRPGAGGSIGAEAVTRSAPDGHVVLCAPDPVFLSHLLTQKPGFDPRTLQPVSVVVGFRMALVARAGLPVRDLADLIAHARANPGALTYASQGPGQYGHLVMEALKQRAGIDILHVPFAGAAPAMNGLVTEQVDLFAGTLVATIGQVQAGRLKLLGPTGARRLPTYPDLPALPEVVRGLSAESWMALAVPPGTPAAIIDRLSSAAAAAIRAPEIAAQIDALQCEPLGTTPAEMRAMLERATAQWSAVIAGARISLD